jgi:hypothetical protein
MAEARVVLVLALAAGCATASSPTGGRVGFTALVGVELGAGVTGIVCPVADCSGRAAVVVWTLASALGATALAVTGPSDDPTTLDWALAGGSAALVAAGVTLAALSARPSHPARRPPADPWLAFFASRDDAEVFARALRDCRVDAAALADIEKSARDAGIDVRLAPDPVGQGGPCVPVAHERGGYVVRFLREGRAGARP